MNKVFISFLLAAILLISFASAALPESAAGPIVPGQQAAGSSIFNLQGCALTAVGGVKPEAAQAINTGIQIYQFVQSPTQTGLNMLLGQEVVKTGPFSVVLEDLVGLVISPTSLVLKKKVTEVAYSTMITEVKKANPTVAMGIDGCSNARSKIVPSLGVSGQIMAKMSADEKTGKIIPTFKGAMKADEGKTTSDISQSFGKPAGSVLMPGGTEADVDKGVQKYKMKAGKGTIGNLNFEGKDGTEVEYDENTGIVKVSGGGKLIVGTMMLDGEDVVLDTKNNKFKVNGNADLSGIKYQNVECSKDDPNSGFTFKKGTVTGKDGKPVDVYEVEKAVFDSKGGCERADKTLGDCGYNFVYDGQQYNFQAGQGGHINFDPKANKISGTGIVLAYKNKDPLIGDVFANGDIEIELKDGKVFKVKLLKQNSRFKQGLLEAFAPTAEEVDVFFDTNIIPEDVKNGIAFSKDYAKFKGNAGVVKYLMLDKEIVKFSVLGKAGSLASIALGTTDKFMVSDGTIEITAGSMVNLFRANTFVVKGPGGNAEFSDAGYIKWPGGETPTELAVIQKLGGVQAYVKFLEEYNAIRGGKPEDLKKFNDKYAAILETLFPAEFRQMETAKKQQLFDEDVKDIQQKQREGKLSKEEAIQKYNLLKLNPNYVASDFQDSLNFDIAELSGDVATQKTIMARRIAALKQEIRKNPLEPSFYASLASANDFMGDTKESEKNYLKAISLYDSAIKSGDKTKVTQARLGKADALTRLKRYDDAIKEYSSVVSTEKDKELLSTALLSRATLYSEQKNNDGAIKDFDRLSRDFADDPQLKLIADVRAKQLRLDSFLKEGGDKAKKLYKELGGKDGFQKTVIGIVADMEDGYNIAYNGNIPISEKQRLDALKRSLNYLAENPQFIGATTSELKALQAQKDVEIRKDFDAKIQEAGLRTSSPKFIREADKVCEEDPSCRGLKELSATTLARLQEMKNDPKNAEYTAEMATVQQQAISYSIAAARRENKLTGKEDAYLKYENVIALNDNIKKLEQEKAKVLGGFGSVPVLKSWLNAAFTGDITTSIEEQKNKRDAEYTAFIDAWTKEGGGMKFNPKTGKYQDITEATSWNYIPPVGDMLEYSFRPLPAEAIEDMALVVGFGGAGVVGKTAAGVIKSAIPQFLVRTGAESVVFSIIGQSAELAKGNNVDVFDPGVIAQNFVMFASFGASGQLSKIGAEKVLAKIPFLSTGLKGTMPALTKTGQYIASKVAPELGQILGGGTASNAMALVLGGENAPKNIGDAAIEFENLALTLPFYKMAGAAAGGAGKEASKSPTKYLAKEESLVKQREQIAKDIDAYDKQLPSAIPKEKVSQLNNYQDSLGKLYDVDMKIYDSYSKQNELLSQRKAISSQEYQFNKDWIEMQKTQRTVMQSGSDIRVIQRIADVPTADGTITIGDIKESQTKYVADAKAYVDAVEKFGQSAQKINLEGTTPEGFKSYNDWIQSQRQEISRVEQVVNEKVKPFDVEGEVVKAGPDSTMDKIKNLLAIPPTPAKILSTASYDYNIAKDYPKAEETSKKAVEDTRPGSPENSNAQLLLANSLKEQGATNPAKLDSAIKEYQKFLNRYSEGEYAGNLLGVTPEVVKVKIAEVQLAQGKTAEAVKTLRDARVSAVYTRETIDKKLTDLGEKPLTNEMEVADAYRTIGQELTNTLTKSSLTLGKNQLSYFTDLISAANNPLTTTAGATVYHKGGKSFKVTFTDGKGNAQIASVDIQNFKRINDEASHVDGDKLIGEMGNLLEERLKSWKGEPPEKFLGDLLSSKDFKNALSRNVGDVQFAKGKPRPIPTSELNFYAGVSEKFDLMNLKVMDSAARITEIQKYNDQALDAGKTAQLRDIGGIQAGKTALLKDLDAAKRTDKTAVAAYDTKVDNYIKNLENSNPDFYKGEYDFFKEAIYDPGFQPLVEQRTELQNKLEELTMQEKDTSEILKQIKDVDLKLSEKTLLDKENNLNGNDNFKNTINYLARNGGKTSLARVFVIGGDEIGFIISGNGEVRVFRVDINYFSDVNSQLGVNVADSVKSDILNVIDSVIQAKGASARTDADLANEIIKKVNDIPREFEVIDINGKTKRVRPSISIGETSSTKELFDAAANGYDVSSTLNKISDISSRTAKDAGKKVLAEQGIINPDDFFYKKEFTQSEIAAEVKSLEENKVTWKPDAIKDTQYDFIKNYDINARLAKQGAPLTPEVAPAIADIKSQEAAFSKYVDEQAAKYPNINPTESLETKLQKIQSADELLTAQTEVVSTEKVVSEAKIKADSLENIISSQPGSEILRTDKDSYITLLGGRPAGALERGGVTMETINQEKAAITKTLEEINKKFNTNFKVIFGEPVSLGTGKGFSAVYTIYDPASVRETILSLANEKLANGQDIFTNQEIEAAKTDAGLESVVNNIGKREGFLFGFGEHNTEGYISWYSSQSKFESLVSQKKIDFKGDASETNEVINFFRDKTNYDVLNKYFTEGEIITFREREIFDAVTGLTETGRNLGEMPIQWVSFDKAETARLDQKYKDILDAVNAPTEVVPAAEVKVPTEAAIKLIDAEVNRLKTNLRSERDFERYDAANALGDLGSSAKDSVAALRFALLDSADIVRSSSAVALGKIGANDINSIYSLRNALGDSSYMVRGLAAEALGKLNAESVVADLKSMAFNDLDATARIYAERAIREINVKNGREAVPSKLSDVKDRYDLFEYLDKVKEIKEPGITYTADYLKKAIEGIKMGDGDIGLIPEAPELGGLRNKVSDILFAESGIRYKSPVEAVTPEVAAKPIEEISRKVEARNPTQIKEAADVNLNRLKQANDFGKGELGTPKKISDINNLNLERSVVDRGVVYLPKEGKAVFVGDTHGELSTLKQIISDTNFIERVENGEKLYLVLTGDYVDRGPQSIENIETLLELKQKYPDKVILLRGNHETPSVNAGYGFKADLFDAYGETGKEIWGKYNEVFNELPYALVTGNGIVAVHGGIPEGIKSMDDLMKMSSSQKDQAVWNDPRDNINNFEESDRGIGKFFGKKAFSSFMDNVGGKVMIRAHEYSTEGYKTSFDDRLITIFSAKYGEAKVSPKYLEVDLSKTVDDFKGLAPESQKSWVRLGEVGKAVELPKAKSVGEAIKSEQVRPIENELSKATNRDELYSILDNIGYLEGSGGEVYSSAELEGLIEDVWYGRQPINVLTRTNGLRQAVAGLIANDQMGNALYLKYNDEYYGAYVKGKNGKADTLYYDFPKMRTLLEINGQKITQAQAVDMLFVHESLHDIIAKEKIFVADEETLVDALSKKKVGIALTSKEANELAKFEMLKLSEIRPEVRRVFESPQLQNIGTTRDTIGNFMLDINRAGGQAITNLESIDMNAVQARLKQQALAPTPKITAKAIPKVEVITETPAEFASTLNKGNPYILEANNFVKNGDFKSGIRLTKKEIDRLNKIINDPKATVTDKQIAQNNLAAALPNLDKIAIKADYRLTYDTNFLAKGFPDIGIAKNSFLTIEVVSEFYNDITKSAGSNRIYESGPIADMSFEMKNIIKYQEGNSAVSSMTFRVAKDKVSKSMAVLTYEKMPLEKIINDPKTSPQDQTSAKEKLNYVASLETVSKIILEGGSIKPSVETIDDDIALIGETFTKTVALRTLFSVQNLVPNAIQAPRYSRIEDIDKRASDFVLQGADPRIGGMHVSAVNTLKENFGRLVDKGILTRQEADKLISSRQTEMFSTLKDMVKEMIKSGQIEVLDKLKFGDKELNPYSGLNDMRVLTSVMKNSYGTQQENILFSEDKDAKQFNEVLTLAQSKKDAKFQKFNYMKIQAD
jgi:protein phosphatase